MERRKISIFLSEYKRQIREEAEKLMTLRLPDITEELFSQFEKTGNRLIYESVYFTRRKFLVILGLKALIEKKENGKAAPRTIDRLAEIIRDICCEECWAVPAHLSRANQDWQITIDLFAAETAQTLSELADRLKEEIPDDLYNEISENVERRVLRPFFASEQYGWEKADHNWNAVCTGSIGSACIHLRGRSLQTDACLKRICDSLSYYINGFADDGTCMEGCGYFTYGMSYFVNFAQELYEYSKGQIDLLRGDWGRFRKGDIDKRSAIASFQSKCFFHDGRTVNFSDGNSRDKFSLGLNLALKHHFADVAIPDLRRAADLFHDQCFRFVFRKLDLIETERYLKSLPADEEEDYSAKKSIHVLADAQWCIANADNGAAIACKGGHNAEAHNHNDVGHFIYEGKGVTFFADLGAGEYTRNYFSDKRYEILCNNSFGHSVPVLDGKGQLQGVQHRCESFAVTKSADRVTIDMDISGAYGKVPDSVLRKMEFSMTQGSLKVMDQFSLQEKECIHVVENLITQIKPVIYKDRILLTDGGVTAVLIVDGVDHTQSVKVKEYTHSNHAGQKEAVYAIQWEVAHNGKGVFEIYMKNESRAING